MRRQTEMSEVVAKYSHAIWLVPTSVVGICCGGLLFVWFKQEDPNFDFDQLLFALIMMVAPTLLLCVGVLWRRHIRAIRISESILEYRSKRYLLTTFKRCEIVQRGALRHLCIDFQDGDSLEICLNPYPLQTQLAVLDRISEELRQRP